MPEVRREPRSRVHSVRWRQPALVRHSFGHKRVGQEVCKEGFYWNCSQCHSACSKDDAACHARCDATGSCRGPQGRQDAENAIDEDAGVSTPTPPNVLILLVDDMGYSDTAAFGSPNASTPHIDALVSSGMKFTQWISAASICTPSRASLQTGRYPIRTGCMGNVEQFRVIPTPASPGGLDPRTETSLAAALKQRGYARTGYSGKWHLGINSNKIGAPQDHRFTPNAHGYDTYVGAPWTNAPMCEMDSDTGTSTKYKSGPKYCFLTHNDTVVEMPLRVENFTRTITHHALEFLSERAVAREAALAVGQSVMPWFFMMSWFHVHTPLFTNRTNRGRSQGGSLGITWRRWMTLWGLSWVPSSTMASPTTRLSSSPATMDPTRRKAGPCRPHECGWGRLKGGKGQLFEGGVRMPGDSRVAEDISRLAAVTLW